VRGRNGRCGQFAAKVAESETHRGAVAATRGGWQGYEQGWLRARVRDEGGAGGRKVRRRERLPATVCPLPEAYLVIDLDGQEDDLVFIVGICHPDNG